MEPTRDNYAGAEVASGRRPVTLAVLTSDLEVITIHQCSVPDAISLLEEYKVVQLAINTPGSKPGQALCSDLKQKLLPAGFVLSSKNEGDRTWIETKAQECFQTFHSHLFARRTLEGRIQRALILYEEGVQIPDPMDFFEEITRHKLLQGILPNENIYSVKQLDALVAAYLSWLDVHRPHRTETRGDLVLPKFTDND